MRSVPPPVPGPGAGVDWVDHVEKDPIRVLESLVLGWFPAEEAEPAGKESTAGEPDDLPEALAAFHRLARLRPAVHRFRNPVLKQPRWFSGPQQRGVQVEAGQVAVRGFVIPGGDAPPGLEVVDQAFDGVPLPAEVGVVADGSTAPRAHLPVGGLVLLLRDHFFDTASAQVVAVAAGYIGLVHDDRIRSVAGSADGAADPYPPRHGDELRAVPRSARAQAGDICGRRRGGPCWSARPGSVPGQVHPGGVLVSARGGGVDADQGQVHLAPPHGLRDQALQQGLEDAGPASRHCRKQLETVDQAPNSVGISRHSPPVLNRRITSSNCCRSRSCYGPYAPIGK